MENQISDTPSYGFGNLCPLGIPEDIRPTLRDRYGLYDMCRNSTCTYEAAAVAKIGEMMWETRDAKLPGHDTTRIILTTAPAIGEATAAVWLAYVVTPTSHCIDCFTISKGK